MNSEVGVVSMHDDIPKLLHLNPIDKTKQERKAKLPGFHDLFRKVCFRDMTFRPLCKQDKLVSFKIF
jgi:hypothetical protein